MLRQRVPWVACLLVLFGAATAPPIDTAQAQVSPKIEGFPDTTGLIDRFGPGFENYVRRRIQRSGMSPQQIRLQLRQAGLPSTLLDAYLGGTGIAAQPRLRSMAPTADVMRAMTVLGLGTADELQAYADSIRFRAHELRDSLRVLDSLWASGSAGALTVFGRRVFRRATTQFLPSLSGPVGASYRLGPGDVLVLILTGDVEMAHTLEVTREGFVVVPQVGQIYVSNLTMAAAREVMRQRLERSYSGIRTGTTRFEVTVARLRMNQVYVIGEVETPGSYEVPSVSTVMTALYQAGGPTEDGSFRKIIVGRRADTVATLDLYDYLLSGVATDDVRLESGDVVFVPLHGRRVKLVGAVLRPAIYEVSSGETLADLIRMAGGFRPDAMMERLAVHRILPPGERPPGSAARATIDVPLGSTGPDQVASLRDGPGTRERAATLVVPPLPLEDGDSVVVDSIAAPDEALFVEIGGMVRRPGRYPWQPGMTLKDLVFLARGPVVGAYLREAEIARLPELRREGELSERVRVPLDSSYLFHRDSLGSYVGPAGLTFPPEGTAPEVSLEPFDQVTILKQPEFELQRRVAISGEVRFAGPYALTGKSERVSQLVERAGGLLPTAYPEGARLVRMEGNAGRINLDLPRALERPGSAADIVLQPGDSLTIPEFLPTVKVEGAVNAAISVLYKEGAGLDYYIANAGGYAPNADKGGVIVRYANGTAEVKSRFLIFTSSPKPGPGSVVTVPKKDDSGGVNMTQLLGSVAQILAATVAIIAVATR